MAEYVEFRRYPNIEAIRDIVELFDDNDIDYLVDTTKPSFDITFTNGSKCDYILKVADNQVDAAEKLLFIDYDKMSQVHFMDTFTDEELKNVIATPDDWEPSDYAYAKKLLADKNIVVTDEEQQIRKSLTDKRKFKPKHLSFILILIGYLLSLFVIGIVISIYVLSKKQKISDHETISFYDGKSITHAIFMFLITIAVTSFLSIYFSQTC